MDGLLGLAMLADRHGPGVRDAGERRTCPPEATLAHWQPEMDRFGITRVADIAELDVVGLPVAQAIRPNSKSLSVSQGKGATVAAARVGALMEAAELWHSEQPMACSIDATPAELLRGKNGHDVVDLARLPRRRGAQVDHGTTMRWVEGLSLSSGRPCWVPEVCVSMDETPPRDPLLDVLHVTTAGLASGNHYLEAVAHGAYELIERDACVRAMRRWRLGEALPRIDPCTVTGTTTRWMVERCVEAGLQMVLTDVTSDLAVPVILCELVEYPTNPFRPIPLAAGVACHPDADQAIASAIGEAVQSRLGSIAASRDDLTAAVYANGLNGSTSDEALEAYLSRVPTIDAASLGVSREPCLVDELGAVAGRLISRRAVDIVVVDLVQRDVGLPVVRVLAAGLRDGAS